MTRQLAERTENGVTVEVNWLPKMDMVVLRAYTVDHDESQAATVPADRVMDAFWHPACYLPQPDQLFR
jgi:hypothetical protein